MRTLSLKVAGHSRRARIVGQGEDLLLFFHGSRQSGAVARRFSAGTFEWPGWTVAYLDGVGHHFNDLRRCLDERTRREGVDDVAFARAVVEQLRPQRVWACGYSNGGHMVLRLLIDAPGLLTGAAVLAATQPTPDNLLPHSLDGYVPTPVLFMNGTADAISPYGGGVAGLDASSGRGTGLSAPETARLWARRNGCLGAPEELRYAPDVSVLRWPSVELWSLEGCGHVIPTGQPAPPMLGATTDSVVAAEVIAQFFARR